MQNDHSSLVAALERIATVVRHLQWSAAYAEGINPIQLQVLQLCAARQPVACTPTALATELNVSAPSISDTLSALERKQLVLRQPHPTDRRGTIVTLTERGHALLERLRRWDKPLQTSIATLPEAQQEATYETLLELLRQLYRDGLISMPRMCLTCRWLERTEHNYRTPYRCRLLAMDLLPLELRIDCPEHQAD